MVIDFRTGKADCSVCGKKTTLDDLVVIWEEEKLNKSFEKLMRCNRGVGGNY